MDQQPKVLFLVNARSGNDDGAQLIRTLKTRFAGTVDVREIAWGSLESSLEASKAYRYLVVAGGDGTCSSILRALPKDGPPVALYPLGTGNDLARELGFARFWEHGVTSHVLDSLEHFTTRELDQWGVWNVDSGELLVSFINYCSFGFSAVVVESFAAAREASRSSPLRGRIRNRIQYLRYCLSHLTKFIDPSITIGPSPQADSTSVGGARCLLFSSIRSLMGLGKTPFHSDPFDGHIEAITVFSLFDYLLFALSASVTMGRFIGTNESWTVRGLAQEHTIHYDGESAPFQANAIRISRLRTVRVLTTS